MNYRCIKDFSKGIFPEHHGCMLFKDILEKEYQYWFLSKEKITSELLNHTSQVEKTDLARSLYGEGDLLLRRRRNRTRFQIVDNQLYFVRGYSRSRAREREWRKILKTLLQYVLLEDTDFVINMLDEPCVIKHSCVPLFSICKTDAHEDLLLPNFFGIQTFTDPYSWEQKENRCIWRGSTTGGGNLHGCWKKYPRSVLVRLKEQFPDLDVAYTGFVQHDKRTLSLMQNSLSLEQYVPLKDQCAYKYFVQVDGNTTAWRFVDLLASNSVVFKQQSQFYEFYYPLLKANEHYVSIGPYCEDLPQKIEWAKANDFEAKKIAENASRFVRENLTVYDYYCYLWNTLTFYTQLLGLRVSVHRKAKRA
jgi:hypothetical protein